MVNIENIKEIMEENNIEINCENMEEKTFLELGIDSVDMMMMIFSIKEKYQIDFIINRENTIEHLLTLINKEINNKK